MYQLVPPHQHCQNSAETAIKTVRSRLLSGIATCHQHFPITEWDMLLPQAEMTLNLLRNSRVNPKISAWTYLNGPHDFNRHPIAPPGSKILVHTKPSNRASWAFHGVQGWYVGLSLNHYRCVKCFIPTTRSEIIFDTIKFIPKYIPIPTASVEDHIKTALEHVVKLLKNKNNINCDIFNSHQPSTAFVQVSNTLNHPKFNGISNLQKLPAPPTESLNSVPQPKCNITSEGAGKKNKRSTKKKYKPMSDEEFELLLKILCKPNETSEGEKRHQKASPTITTKSLRDNYMYTNVPLPKGGQNSTNCISMTSNKNLTINHMYDGTGKKQPINKLLKINPEIWSVALSNELGRLAQGIRDIEGNNVFDFISHLEVPADRIITYDNMVCDIRPLKTEKFRVRLAVGGDRLQYPDDTTSPAATLLETKLLLNSTISQSARG